MNLQNGYKVIYEKIADGERTFFADKMDGTEATKINETPFKIGEYKLIFEKDGLIYGSTSGKVEDGECLKDFNKVFVEGYKEEAQEPAAANVDPEVTEPEATEPNATPVVENEEEPEADPEEEE